MEAFVAFLILFILFLCTLTKRKDCDRAYFVPALIAAGTALYGIIQSERQKKKAREMKPSNYVPPSVRAAEVSAKMDANAQSPAAARGLERIKQSSANAISAAKRVGGSAAQIQQAVNDTDAREKEALKDLSVADAENQANNRQRYRDILMAKGGYEQQSQDAYNASKSALTGAAQQNQYNAITTLGEGIVNSLPDNTISPAATGATGNISGSGALAKIAKNGQSLKMNPAAGGGPLSDDQLKYLYQQMGQMKKYKPSFRTGY